LSAADYSVCVCTSFPAKIRFFDHNRKDEHAQSTLSFMIFMPL
jgi:hypothetical protein